ncbi:histidine kinase [Formosa sp. S-31]
MISILVVVTGLVILFFLVFQKRKNKLLLDRVKQKQLFEEELAQTQIEIQEQTLKNIGQDLHDNVGQLLSVANMQLSMLSKQVSSDLEETFIETKGIVKESLREVRALSKSLNSDVIVHRGFQESVSNEVARLNKLGIIEAELTVEGDAELFQKTKDSIILFRIVQEFFSNTIKYSEASHLNVSIQYFPEYMEVKVNDDGIGFDKNEIEQGAGLINMESRAALINSELKLYSKPKEGVHLEIKYPYRDKELL